jgi:hypothetical protein
MNTGELNDELNALKARVVLLANGETHSEQAKNHLSDLVDKLEAAQDDQVPDDVKATALSIGELILNAMLLPPWTVDDLDSKLFGSILQGRVLLQ